MSYVIKAVLSNTQHPECGQTTIPLNDLCAAGYLSRENRWRENGGCTSNLYKICDSS